MAETETTTAPTAPAPADRLREAAGVVRAHLADPKLTAGPWTSLDGGDRIIRNQRGDERWAPVYVIDEPTSNSANAAWIALMNPGVGAALAAWLETEAHSAAGDEKHDHYCVIPYCGTVAALAVADAILTPAVSR